MALMDIVVRRVTTKLKGLSATSLSELATKTEAELYSTALAARTAFTTAEHATESALTTAATAAREFVKRPSVAHLAPEPLASAERASPGRLSSSVAETMKSLQWHDVSTKVLAVFDVNAVHLLPAGASIGSRIKGYFLPYVPMWTFFLNMYYLGGVSNCMKIFVCTGSCHTSKPVPMASAVLPYVLACWPSGLLRA